MIFTFLFDTILELFDTLFYIISVPSFPQGVVDRMNDVIDFFGLAFEMGHNVFYFFFDRTLVLVTTGAFLTIYSIPYLLAIIKFILRKIPFLNID